MVEPVTVAIVAVVVAICSLIVAGVTASQQGQYVMPALAISPSNWDVYPESTCVSPNAFMILPNTSFTITTGSSGRDSQITFEVILNGRTVGTPTVTPISGSAAQVVLSPSATWNAEGMSFVENGKETVKDRIALKYTYDGWEDRPWYTGGDNKKTWQGTLYDSCRVEC